MRQPQYNHRAVILRIAVGICLFTSWAAADGLHNYKCPAGFDPAATVLVTSGQFNGYTNYWHDVYWRWAQYGNLYLVSQPEIPKMIAQNKIDTAEELGLPGLVMAEGFLKELLRGPVREMDEPEAAGLEKALDSEDVLLWVKPSTELGKKIAGLLPDLTPWRDKLSSHQLNAKDFREIRAFVLFHGRRRLFAVISDSAPSRARFKELIGNVRDVVAGSDLHRGWFGTGTLLHSVTCFPGHPLEVIGKGLGQGNDWFTFSGYMDYMMQAELPGWLAKVGLDVVTDVGTGKASHSIGTIAYGLRTWDGLKIQDTPTEEGWIQFVKDRGGHIFRPVYAPECDKFTYDGYIAIDGNQKQIDEENVPFILQTGFIREEAPACMVLFTKKGSPMTRELMWDAILGRRAVGVLSQGKMMGPASLRTALQMLLLDRAFLEDYFGDRIQVTAAVEGQELVIRAANAGDAAVSGTVEIRPAPELQAAKKTFEAALPPRSERAFRTALRPSLDAMGKANPVRVDLSWPGGRKRALTVYDLPPAVSVHKLLYGQAPEVTYPVSVHNFSGAASYPVDVKIFTKDAPGTAVYSTSMTGKARPGEHEELSFRLPLKAGSYTVEVTALGASNKTQLGVEPAAGSVTLTEVDLNGDGLMEYRLENAKVRVTLLRIGARVIEDVVKARNDNVLFKLWPEKEDTDKRPFRERGFYPYGGFEDFLGQASIETHKVYEAEVLRRGGSCAQVRMWADYYGNRLEKIFTLYGNSPLVEVRFAIEFRNPELHMLGPQPILELGKRHWTEDVFVLPTTQGLRQVRMRPEEYFGEVLMLKEGWNAGRDTVEDVCFVGAYPVSEPEFLHMWMNHPSNGESHHYYAEFQPWVPIFQKTVRYFSYYLWADSGPWEKAVEALRRRNLITSR